MNTSVSFSSSSVSDGQDYENPYAATIKRPLLRQANIEKRKGALSAKLSKLESLEEKASSFGKAFEELLVDDILEETNKGLKKLSSQKRQKLSETFKEIARVRSDICSNMCDELEDTISELGHNPLEHNEEFVANNYINAARCLPVSSARKKIVYLNKAIKHLDRDIAASEEAEETELRIENRESIVNEVKRRMNGIKSCSVVTN